jgi:FixJ family two-component response regulator
MEQGHRIIVLDDEAELRNMLQRFLTGHGFQVRPWPTASSSTATCSANRTTCWCWT